MTGGDGGSSGVAAEGGAGGTSDAGGAGGSAGTSPAGGDAGAAGSAGEAEQGGGSGSGDRGGSGGTGIATAGQGGCDDGSDCGFVEPPSCVELAPSCGPDRENDCCASSLIPASSLGPFARSNDPDYPATVSDFRLDDYELTVGRFRVFASAYADGWRPSDGSGKNSNNPDDSGWDGATWSEFLPASTVDEGDRGVACDDTYQTWTASPGDNEARPQNCLTWYLAYAFCIWDGGRLPTEAEWNYAAAGGGDAAGWRQYPWSDPSSSVAIDVTNASYFSTDCFGDGEPGCGLDDILVVGSKPAGDGRFGQADLAGNVCEWVQDANADYPMPCADCSNLLSGDVDRICRGGGFDTDASFLLSSDRRGRSPLHRLVSMGARCARNAP
jgi:formylglycine-generating enzyme required for sulfatase activity